MDESQESDTTQPRQLSPRIESDPAILSGKPVIAGSRLSVAIFLDALASGGTFGEIIEAYTFLTREDITAAIEHAS